MLPHQFSNSQFIALPLREHHGEAGRCGQGDEGSRWAGVPLLRPSGDERCWSEQHALTGCSCTPMAGRWLGPVKMISL